MLPKIIILDFRALKDKQYLPKNLRQTSIMICEAVRLGDSEAANIQRYLVHHKQHEPAHYGSKQLETGTSNDTLYHELACSAVQENE